MSPPDAAGLTRREALQLSIVAGTALFLPHATAMPATDDFEFLAVNDLHYHNAECDEWFTTVFAAMKESAPRAEFIILGGDLADEGKPEQLQGFHRLLPQLNFPFHAVPGNHDCATATDRTIYETLFAGHINSAFVHRGWQFIGLDTADGDNWHDTTIPASTIDFLTRQLATVSPKTPLVVFTHFPLGENIFLPPQKPGSPTYNFRPLNADVLLEKLSGFNLQAILCGHYHSFTERKLGSAILTTNKCCSRVQKNHDGSPEKGWFVCEARSGKISRRFVEIPALLR